MVLFFVYGATQQQETRDPKQIIVSQGKIEQLIAQFKRVSIRPPSQQEIDELIEGYIRDEVFYRQGLVLGLDVGDPVVKQRLRMKLEVLLEDLNEQAQPSDEVLLAFMEKNAQSYMKDAIFSFEHIYINISKHKNVEKTAHKIKQQIANNISVETLGDRLILPPKLNKVTDYEVNRLFGKEFTQSISKLPINQWSSIIYSGYGGHLVKLTAFTASKPESLPTIKAEVLQDYLMQRRTELKDKTYQKLRSEYDISIENSTDSASK